MRRLLIAEMFTRWCDWLVREFVVIYIVVVRGVPVEVAGMLFTLQHFVALLTYLPERLRFLADYRMVIYSTLLVVMMLTRPQGILGKRAS